VPVCKAQATCKEYHKDVSENMLSLLPDNTDVPSVPIETLVDIFRKRKQIEHYLEAVSNYLHTALEAGVEVPGVKLVRGRRVRKWRNDISPDKLASELTKLGCAEPYRLQLQTIGFVERVVGKGKLDDLTELPEGKLQVVLEEDSRDSENIALLKEET